MKRLLIVPLFAATQFSMPVSAHAEEWTYTDGSGATITLNEVPTRLITSAVAAAALIPLGIRPVGIFANSVAEENKPLIGLDLTGIEMVGTAFNEIDIEKVAALEPDLVVAEFYPINQAWAGGKAVTGEGSPLRNLAPVTGPAQADSIVTLIEDYEELATSLGADLSAPQISADKAEFERARDAFRVAVAAKPNLTALAVWAGIDALHVAAPEGAAELMDLRSWGLDIITPETANDRGYWETVSWEQSDKYQPDLILIDNRIATNRENAFAQPTWTAMKAAEQGAVGEWPAFWLRNYTSYAAELDKLTAAVTAADENLVEE
ncbi:ABC transporter substrate-binding protein [Devosia nitrariae]|uniref:ABC transporter substrate-binding protein n=1 Tax=Devosia nitrariae TaxID=2071872 RepID=A0ABQ5WDD2_9HYPH|nr:ABC transporter substrate-binding protein [Devosia nitrariae]GLQ57888.1 ABC transporter substrate-binding protein [Devosia nitrariae]